MSEHKSLLRDFRAYWEKKHPPKRGYEFNPRGRRTEASDALPEFIQAFRDERSEQRAHIDSMTRIILDLTEQLTREREHIKKLEAEITELSRRKRA